MRSVFAEHRPAVVFHAAAYKHVPLCEDNVLEAIRNNVFGTLNLVACAARFRTKKFVLISSDKAVNPTSIMGTTKRVAERITLAWPRFRKSVTDFRAVRFGNVLGSDGSVVPLFKKQIAEGGPLTVTHPEVRRYFMSIPEAVELVLQAAALPDARRKILMLEMGEPVRIVDLAEQLVRFSGLVPHKDIRIVFTGLRPGEKLDEELVSASESHERTDVEKVRVVQTTEPHCDELQTNTARLRQAVQQSCAATAIAELRRLVPEYAPPAQNGQEVAHRRRKNDTPRDLAEAPTHSSRNSERQAVRLPGPSAVALATAPLRSVR
jgi:FlaA1/EpsC-like NDP-sugar epimerase